MSIAPENPELTRPELAAMLRFQIEAGVSDMLENTPINRFETLASAPASAPKSPLKPSPKKEPRDNIAKAKPENAVTMADIGADIAAAEKSASNAPNLDALRDAVTEFDLCPLKITARKTVFSDGNPAAKLMLIGEAPGDEDDREGKPFIGASGLLLDKMFGAIGLTRADFYITNIVPWRPPGKRAPTPTEIAVCLPFLKRQIDLLQPDIIVLVGGVAAKEMLATADSISKIRGTWHHIELNGRKIPAMPIFHPAHLLKTPKRKAETWRDLLTLQARLQNVSPNVKETES